MVIEKAFQNLMKKSPFYAYLLLGVVLKEDNNVKTMSIKFTKNGEILFLYNKKINKKPIWFVESLILHELMHIINQHFRIKPKNNREKKIWDLAMDAAINQYIPELDARSVPLNVLIQEGHGVDNEYMFAAPPPFMINKTAEEYFDWMMKEFEKKGDFDIEALPDSLDDHNFESDLPIEMIIEITKDKVGKAFNMFGKELESGLKQNINISLQKSTLDWETLIRRFSNASIKGDKYRTPLRPNRRYDDQPGWKYEYNSKLAVIVDTSASIIEEELNQFLTEIEKIAKYDSKLLLIQVDQAVTMVTEYSSGKWKDLEIYGGGETNLQPAVDLAQSHNVEGIIIFTDGHVDVPVVKRRVLFVLSSKHNPDFIEDAVRIYGRSSIVILK
ncbi:hypothetical protein Ob7_07932 [Thermosipho africanus Ob7]|jgi:predicted metal-dependent peptidase|uniref:VWA-like domain-containing protein n=1 Tax=Thermosipho africanus (strain TCF52B) TaxID=484019 RepID=B7IGM8_THEAB|nr:MULTISPECIES: VWA-like domain-containing protein [Thermosipho]ACJ75242.1 conserved hypothetical protein [Thermosipho africanus TCF52B]MBZ4649866.1 hypothetical protein [Thermosipho sp. (in: thermotogales)]MDK2839431.1 hypothetical protein [Thermosipho sp. (in: thermotogales)]MDK2899796.1 hypothetical protein [Thermosipho sp. (in: thermotogales)]RDI90631.1 hypothetical protein Ob7_07932 [Thermosipho africanus Ob7]